MSEKTLNLRDAEVVYPYSTGNKLEDRNTYFYSGYYGEVFFTAWRTQRSKALALCEGKASASTLFLAFWGEDIDLFVENLPKFNLIETDTLLNILMAAQLKYSTDTSAFPLSHLLRQFVKKVEVSKRVHEEYKGAELLIDGCLKYHDSSLYLKAAYVFLTAYKDTLGLQYLNAFLKITDTLCSIVHLRGEFLIREHLSGLIDSETSIVRSLIVDAGGNCDGK